MFDCRITAPCSEVPGDRGMTPFVVSGCFGGFRGSAPPQLVLPSRWVFPNPCTWQELLRERHSGCWGRKAPRGSTCCWFFSLRSLHQRGWVEERELLKPPAGK